MAAGVGAGVGAGVRTGGAAVVLGATSTTILSIAASPAQLDPRMPTKVTTGFLPAKGERSTVAVCHLLPLLPVCFQTLAGDPPWGVTVTSSVPMLRPYMWYANFSVLTLPANGVEASMALCPDLRGEDVSMYM